MIHAKGNGFSRENRKVNLKSDFVIAGGGLAGVCAAIQAARAGLKVILVNDRPVLGGNASSEVRLWALGATSHMGNNNRWSREGGVINEILLENLYRNKEGNAVIFDTVLLDKVVSEPNITLLLNTAVIGVVKNNNRNIATIEAFSSQNSTTYELHGTVYCDASGDGIVGFNSGASFRFGAEAKSEFSEALAPVTANEELLGHSLFFYSKNAGKPVRFVPPSFANKEFVNFPRSKIINEKDSGCRLWWIEYGGVLDTIYDTEQIKWELWSIVYGIWDHIKNSGKFEDVENLTLEWVGTIPGKRESRRFEGEYVLTQQDIVEQTPFDDAVAYGGWAIDLHPSEGVYSDRPPCSQWHSKGIYPIPFRCYYSKDIDNLFIAGRIISASHMAFGSTRVMLTCAHGGQAVGEAAALCVEKGIVPKQLLSKGEIKNLQHRLNLSGQSIPRSRIDQEFNLARSATIEVSSTFDLCNEIEFKGDWITLDSAVGQLIPLKAGRGPNLSIMVCANENTSLDAELRISEKAHNYTPEVSLKRILIDLDVGENIVSLDFSDVDLDSQYGVLILHKNTDLKVKGSHLTLVGLTSVYNQENKAVSNSGRQSPPPDIGIENFEFWTPKRKPNQIVLGMAFESGIDPYSKKFLINGLTRPTLSSNAWVAKMCDTKPSVCIRWQENKSIKGIVLFFDADYDDALESVLMEHSSSVMPSCVSKFKLYDKNKNLIYSCEDNYQSRVEIQFSDPVETNELMLELDHPNRSSPASLYEIYVY